MAFAGAFAVAGTAAGAGATTFAGAAAAEGAAAGAGATTFAGAAVCAMAELNILAVARAAVRYNRDFFISTTSLIITHTDVRVDF